MYNLFIEAANIRTGGGITHLVELLNNLQTPQKYGLKKIVLCAPSRTLQKIHEKYWLIKISHPYLDRSLPFIVLWKIFYCKRHLQNIDVVFNPSGNFSTKIVPYVSMCQNMLVFEKKERNRFFPSFIWIRLNLLKFFQKKSFRRASGVIFVSQYSQRYVFQKIHVEKSKVVYHGIGKNFTSLVKKQQNIGLYTTEKPFKLLYVSTVDVYKHQWNVIEAVGNLVNEGYALELNLVGKHYYKPPYRKMIKAINEFDPERRFVKYHGEVPYNELRKFYQSADAFVFASTCESISFILLEAMKTGLPMICSKYGPTPEIVDNAGVYFDPLCTTDIALSIKQMLLNTQLRQEKAQVAKKRSMHFTWNLCTEQTFSFIHEIYQNNKK